MSPAKGDSSSHYKGKEVATDDPPAETMGGKAPHSESDRGHDLSSECPPLIDPWYDIYIHFPLVLGDYLPPPSSRVWLSICHHDSEVS